MKIHGFIDYAVFAMPTLVFAPALALPVPDWVVWLLIVLATACVGIIKLQSVRRELHAMHEDLARQPRSQLTLAAQILDVIPIPIYVKDADSRYTIANKAFSVARGLPVHEIVGFTTQEIGREKVDTTVSREEDIKVLAGQKVCKEQHDLDPTSGALRHRLITKNLGVGIDGAPIIVGANFDLSRWWDWRKTPMASEQAGVKDDEAENPSPDPLA